VNVVRIGLNQGLWLDGTASCDASCYRSNVARVVSSARAEGLDVILDLHWATANRAVQPQFMEMPDADSVRFWSEVATLYASDGRVLFELYNEPHDIDWATWKNGGTVSGVYDPDTSDTDYARTTPITYQATGMQALYDAVRAAGAHNVVIAGGLDWTFDLRGVPSFGIDGYNVAYAVHLYPFATKLPEFWEQAFGFLGEQVPLLVTEFAPGSTSDPECPEDYTDDVISYTDAARMSWVAWAWFASGSVDDPLARCNSSLFFQEANAAQPVFERTPFGERIRNELSR
jgi:endoglucanase